MFQEQHFHLVGIGGIGMSGLARILRSLGKTVSGSDREETPVTTLLRNQGINVVIGEHAANIPSEAEVVIHTTAAKREANLELLEAAQRHLPLYTYPEALGVITQNTRLIAVAGAHGKSTTTGLLIAGALSAGADISCLVGTNTGELGGGNARVGASPWFVLEACEYRRAFLNLSPEVLIITNIEAEHLDYYKDLADYQSAFVALAQKLPANGALIADSREPNLAPVIAAAPRFIDTASSNAALTLKIPGAHNRKNALLAYTATQEILQLDATKAQAGIGNYTGAWRRFELKGEYRGARIYDDYAHHPTEIRATLAAAREAYPDRRIIAVYQQHQIDRASRFLSEIGAAFGDSDMVIVPDIYRVRDDREVSITGQDIADEIAAHGKPALFTAGFPGTLAWLRENLTANDVVLIMGAGDVWRITVELLADHH